MVRLGLLSLALLAGGLAACGDDEPAAMTAARTTTAAMTSTMARDAADAAPAATRRGRTIKVVDSQFGPVVADRAGEALYLFDAETTTRPSCYGACAAAWPPVLANGEPVVGRGLHARLLGTSRRRDGRVQVTYRGHPLYYYVHDSPGRILCHDVFEYGGTWLVVAPDGRARS
jgi:predicted lipoprotein with Yx(FWY)xxD motif